MTAGSNNPILIEQQLSILNDYHKEINKSIDDINERINFISVSTEKLSDQFNDNMPINARKIMDYIDEVNDDIENLNNDTNFKYFITQLEKLSDDIKNMENYFNNQYLETMNK